MKRILFSHSYFYRLDAKQWRIGEPYPPLMTITAASYMRNEGYEVKLFDVGLKANTKELEGVLSSFKPDYFVIFDDGFNYLTKMCLTSMREAAFGMQKMAKNFEATVITCSSDSTDHAEKYLNEGADFVIKGEGEITLKELVENLSSGDDGKHVAGIFYKEGSDIKASKPRGVNTDLDSLPQAAWDLVDIDSYQKVWKTKSPDFYLNLATTRGCPYKCNWCAKPIYGNRYNTRSPKKVVDEIQFHVENHQVRHFWMCDDIFGLKPGWVQEFRNELSQRNIDISYKIQSRADLLLKEDNIDALVASGLDEAWIGAESGSQKILDAMDKGTTIEQIEKSTELLKQKGVKVAYFIQFGYLGETLEDIKSTIALVLKHMPDKLGASVSYPLPGTKFYDMVKKDLENKANWTDSDDLDMMFHNTYPPHFYKKLHRYLHQRFRIKRGWLVLRRVLMNPIKMRARDVKQILVVGLHLPLSIINKVQLYRFSPLKK
ncbi:B12-binding domain-containing radical SAM protein [Ekhidna sp. To15]|uniref:B12-binding domain-containing radical SAM protein n=1 Tax=Ekhidna sp. To15 TaxID=3395267 RepID=UPI003F525195